MMYFGFQGKLSGEFHPFVLLPDGRIDFGSGYDDQERYYTTNILEKTIELQTIFTANERDDETGKVREYVYSIIKIAEL
jgi:hypothetical protein